VLIRLAGLALLVLSGCATSGENCELNSDCLDGYCFEHKCKQDCVDSEKDCPKGHVCNSVGQCEYDGSGAAPPSAGSDPGGGSAGGNGAGANNPSGGAASNTDTSSSTGTGPQTGAADITSCQVDSGCDSGMCRNMVPNGIKRCTHACSANSQCPSGFRCETIGSEAFCAQSDVGRACSSAGQCNFACLTPVDYCTSTCQSGSDCPNGYGCMPVGNPATNVCVRAEADCAADASQCVAPSACDASANLVVSSCTLACDTASDCPQRALALPVWTCDGVCRRPADVYGPLPGGFEPAQYACNSGGQVVNVCNDGLTIDFDTFSQHPPPVVSCASPTTTDGAPGDACLDSCRYQGGCPYGFGCAALADVGSQRIGLCLVAGSGEVGAVCSSNSQCAFGYCTLAGLCSRDCSKDGSCPEGSSCTAQAGDNVEGLPFRRCE
jgi:hypothetical protein